MNGTIITDIANIENSKNVMKMVTLNPDEPWLWLISELVEGATKMPGWLLTTIEEEGVEETTEALVETTIGKGVTVPEKKIWICSEPLFMVFDLPCCKNVMKSHHVHPSFFNRTKNNSAKLMKYLCWFVSKKGWKQCVLHRKRLRQKQMSVSDK